MDEELTVAVDMANLMSGLIGSVLGAAVSVIILLLTNSYTRKVNATNLAAQREQFELELNANRDRFSLEVRAAREEARAARELDAIANLVTFLQTQFDQQPLDGRNTPDLMAACNLLMLSSRRPVADHWRNLAQRSLRGVVRVERHPLALALVPWRAAYELAHAFPDTIDWPVDEYPDSTGLAVLAGMHNWRDVERQMRVSVELTVRKMLSWAHLTDEEKMTLFDEIVATSRRWCSLVLAGVNFQLGSDAPGPNQPYFRLDGREDLSALMVVAKENAEIDDEDAFRTVRERADEMCFGERPSDARRFAGRFVLHPEGHLSSIIRVEVPEMV